MGFIEKSYKFIITIEDVSCSLPRPVHIALVWIAVSIPVVLSPSRFQSFRFHSVGHQEERFYIVPVDPVGEQRLTVGYPIAQLPVDRYQIGVVIRLALLQ